MARKLAVKNDRLWRGGRITNHLSRLKHFRGHGVHSPFVYSIVRSVLMNPKRETKRGVLVDSLLSVGASRRTAIEVTALAKHCNLRNFSIDSECGKDLIICSATCSPQEVENLAYAAADSGTPIVILAPYRKRELSNKLLKANFGTSLDRLNYLIFLNNHLPKQHFKL